MESSLIGLGGALIGIVLWHFLTRSSQHQQWLRDNRKEEFREALLAISDVTIELMTYIHSHGTTHAQPQSIYLDSQRAAQKILTSRIFIAAELQSSDIVGRFLKIDEEIRKSGASTESVTKMGILIAEIVKLALKS